MRRFGRILAAGLVAVAVASAAYGAAAADGGTEIALRIRDRMLTVVVDAAAVRRLTLAPSADGPKLARADETAISDAVPPGARDVALLVAAEVAGDASPAAIERAYKLARGVRTTLAVTLGRVPEDRIVVAALVGATDAATGAVRLYPITKPTSGAQADGTDILRALALDAAFLGPTVARLPDGKSTAAQPLPPPPAAATEPARAPGAAAASAPSPAPATISSAPVPSAHEARPSPEGAATLPAATDAGRQRPTSGKPTTPAGPTPAADVAPPRTRAEPAARPATADATVRPVPHPAATTARTPTRPRAEAAPQRRPVPSAPPAAAAPGPAASCAPPRRIVNDFYPGGPFVPCAR